MYTVWSEYYGTGEGQTYMVLFTSGYGQYDDGSKNALENFKKTFGAYMALGATVEEGIVLDFPGSKFLLSDAVKASLVEWEGVANMNYHASFHFNFS